MNDKKVIRYSLQVEVELNCLLTEEGNKSLTEWIEQNVYSSNPVLLTDFLQVIGGERAKVQLASFEGNISNVSEHYQDKNYIIRLVG